MGGGAYARDELLRRRSRFPVKTVKRDVTKGYGYRCCLIYSSHISNFFLHFGNFSATNIKICDFCRFLDDKEYPSKLKVDFLKLKFFRIVTIL